MISYEFRIMSHEPSAMSKLTIKVLKIKGSCPVYKVRDRIVVDEGYKLNLKETDNVCVHSLASIMPYYVVLSKGVDPKLYV